MKNILTVIASRLRIRNGIVSIIGVGIVIHLTLFLETAGVCGQWGRHIGDVSG